MESKPAVRTPFEILKSQVYPTLNEAMLKLIDHIVKTQQVRKHQQRLAKYKLLDELEKKKIERERQKQQMGSDYYESDDENYYKALQMDKAEVETIINNRIRRHSLKVTEEEKEDIGGESFFDPIDFLVQQLKLLKKQDGSTSHI